MRGQPAEYRKRMLRGVFLDRHLEGLVERAHFASDLVVFLDGFAAVPAFAGANLDRRRRELMTEVESMRAERRRSSKSIGSMKPGEEREAAKAWESK